MDLTSFLQDKKTPLLHPRLTHIIGQFTGAQASSGILTSLHEARIHDDVMAPGLVDNFKDGCPDVRIPPGVPYLAGEFPLKILPYRTNLHLIGIRHTHLLLPALPLSWPRRRRLLRPPSGGGVGDRGVLGKTSPCKHPCPPPEAGEGVYQPRLSDQFLNQCSRGG